MKAVLISTQPKWCELIARAINPVKYSAFKKIEVRKTKPKLKTPFKVYIYCTQGIVWADYCSSVKAGRGKVIGEFICNEITVADYGYYCVLPKSKTMLDELDLLEYADGKKVYGWHISDLVIYDKPKELSEFIRICPEWEKEEITKKCLKCEHHFISNADCFEGCDCEGELSITRPPQSWCYVNEIGGAAL